MKSGVLDDLARRFASLQQSNIAYYENRRMIGTGEMISYAVVLDPDKIRRNRVDSPAKSYTVHFESRRNPSQ